MKNYTPVFLMLFMFLCSCSTDIDREVPSQNAIFKVTDTHLLKDGRHLVVLNSNMNRQYDYGRVSIYRLREDGEKGEVVSSVLIGSLCGKMTLSSDEFADPTVQYCIDFRVYKVQKFRCTDERVIYQSLQCFQLCISNSFCAFCIV